MKAWIDLFIIVYFVVLNSFYGLLILLSLLEVARRKSDRLPELDSEILRHGTAPPVTVIAPAYNEQETIVDSVRALLDVEYPDFEVVVVNDGSRDQTLETLREAFDLEPADRVVHRRIETEPVKTIYRSEHDDRLVVADKVNGGKGDALNVGINLARSPLVCCIDADTIVERTALLRMIEPYVYHPLDVMAVGGTVRVANGCAVGETGIEEMRLPDSWLARFQIVEYLRAFLFGRMGFNRLGGNLIISGAFGLFLKEAVVDVGGYDDETVGEDMELIVRLHKHGRSTEPPRRVIQIPEPISYTEVPEDFRTLGVQRDRWHRGLADSLWRHKTMFLNPRYGAIGMFVVPVYFFFELIGPLVELFGYGWFLVSILFGFVDWNFAAVFLLVAFFWGALLSIHSLLLDNWSFKIFRGGESGGKLALAAILENLGYRQTTLLYRLRGLIKFLLGMGDWGEMNRDGFDEASESEEAEGRSELAPAGPGGGAPANVAEAEGETAEAEDDRTETS
ncbi:MAG: glycosyltransferase family 2 protein [Bradymonadaceae bacterium]